MKTLALRTALAVTVLCLLATAAAAATQEQVAADADALLADYQALGERVDACPDGACVDAADIISDYHDLEARRSQLHADFGTLSPAPGVPEIAATIDDIDALAGTLGVTMGGWDGWS